MRWIRFLSPLSGMGQRNFPVAPMAHWSPTRAMTRASGSAGSGEHAARRLAGGVLEDAAGEVRVGA